jgi:hypothetical protein
VADIDLNAPEVKELIEAAAKKLADEQSVGLKANRDEILAEKKRLEKKLRDLDGVDPEEFRALKAAAEEAEKKKAAAEGNWKQLEQQLIDRHTKELGKRDVREKALTAALEEELIDAAATRALASEKGAVDLLLPHVAAQMAVVEEDGRFVAVVVDDNGTPRLSENGKAGSRMTVNELVQEMKANERFGRAFEGTGASGSGAAKSEAGGGTVRVIPSGDDKAFLANLDKIAKGEVTVQ